MKRLLPMICAAALARMVCATLQNPQTYWQMCDASAAVALDDTHFAVSDDEGNTLRVFKRGEPEPIHEFEVARFLGVRKKGESDVEGAARVGNRVYWIGSHGRNREGNAAPDRAKFFATEIHGKNGRKLEPVGAPYSRLLDDLIADPRFARFGFAEASRLSPKKQGGLNIEGMCARADGSLLIAFRTPVPGGKALLLPLLNPDKVIENEPAKFGEIIPLDLAGSGIRDICAVGGKFLIIAGASDGSKDFHLYVWDGKSEKPRLINGNFFNKLNPEAIFRFESDPTDVFQILSDDGGRKTGGKECKDLPKSQRHFRAGELRLNLD